MKSLHNYFFKAILCLSAVLVFQSCSLGGKASIENKIDDFVSNDVDLVAVGDINHVLSALEIEVKDGGLQLPDYFEEIAALDGRRSVRELEEVQDMLSEKTGIDYTNVVLAVKGLSTRMDMVICFNVDDPEALESFLMDKNDDIMLSDDGDYKLLGNEKASIVIKGKNAYFILRNGRPLAEDRAIAALEKWQEKASEKPLDNWKKEYLAQNSAAAAIYNMESVSNLLGNYREFREFEKSFSKQSGVDISDICIGARFAFEGNAAKLNLCAFDKSGKIVQNPYGGAFDTDLLKYTTDTDLIAAGCALDREGFSMVENSFAAIIDQEIENIRYYQDYYNYGYDSSANQEISMLTSLKNTMTRLANSLDGSAMVAMGYDGKNLKSIKTLSSANPEKIFHFVGAVAVKNGKGRELFKNLCSSLDEIAAATRSDSTLYVPSTPSGDTFSVKVGSGRSAMTIHCLLDGNNIVFSNTEITTDGGSNFSTDLFKDKTLAVQLSVPKDQNLIAEYDLPCGFSASLSIVDMNYDLEVSLPGTKQNIVPALVKIFLGAASAVR